MEHFWGTLTGSRNNLENLCVPDEKSSQDSALPGPIIIWSKGFCLPFSRQEPKSIFVHLRHWFFFFWLLEPHGGFRFPSTGALHIKLAICIKKMSFRRKNVSVKLDKPALEFTLWLASPSVTLGRFCLHEVCVYLPYRESRSTTVNSGG